MLTVRRAKRYFKSRGRVFYGLCVLVAAVLAVLILEATNTTHLLHKAKVPAVIPVNSSPNQSPGEQTEDSGSASTSKGTKDSQATGGSENSGSSALPLYAPYGDFVSNHSPNLGGSPAPSSESSACNTTPGASCYIKFTNGSVTTRLPTKIADSNGGVIWQWDVKGAGLTTGDWTVSAVASLDGQTKTTADPIMLKVGK